MTAHQQHASAHYSNHHKTVNLTSRKNRRLCQAREGDKVASPTPNPDMHRVASKLELRGLLVIVQRVGESGLRSAIQLPHQKRKKNCKSPSLPCPWCNFFVPSPSALAAHAKARTYYLRSSTLGRSPLELLHRTQRRRARGRCAEQLSRKFVQGAGKHLRNGSHFPGSFSDG